MKKTKCLRKLYRRCVESECPLWITKEVVVKEEGKTFNRHESMCADVWMTAQLDWIYLRLEGIQGATESFRNGMVAISGNTAVPKPAVGTMELLKAIQPMTKLAEAMSKQLNHLKLKAEVRKEIETRD